MKTLTIFTPTYNRADTLLKVYQSLLAQTCNDFEWIIVDDGSQDNTQEIIKNFQDDKNKKFKIKAVKVENRGKHQAINKGVQLAKGKLFLILDSDDYLTSNAVELIVNKSKTVPQNFAGLAFNKGYSVNDIVGTTFSGEYVDAKTTQRRKYNINGDKAEVWYTDILKLFPFPFFDGEKFLSEITIWAQISKAGYFLRWYNDIIYICEYREDGLTRNSTSLIKKNFKGYTYTIKTLLTCGLPFQERIIWLGNYLYNGKQLGYTIKDLRKKVEASFLFSYISYYACYLKKKVRG